LFSQKFELSNDSYEKAREFKNISSYWKFELQEDLEDRVIRGLSYWDSVDLISSCNSKSWLSTYFNPLKYRHAENNPFQPKAFKSRLPVRII